MINTTIKPNTTKEGLIVRIKRIIKNLEMQMNNDVQFKNEVINNTIKNIQL